MKKIFGIIIVFSFLKTSAQKFEGLALTPPMGWNSWNTFQANIDEKLVKQTADLMVSSGMKDAGYTYLVLDDGWMAHERDAKTGDLIPDPVKFPSGMKALVDYVHGKGLKFGLYNCAGTKTCGGYPGTRGYEYQDARFYAALDIDYLKYDWCNTEGITAKEAYGTMSKALKTAGKPIVFSICEWGDNQPWTWAETYGQLWRTTGDISACFDCENKHDTWSSWGVMKIVDMRKDIRKYAGPGHWNDPDMLEVGNGMKVKEDRAHFSLWAMMAAPLIAGNDIRKMSKETQDILINKEVIAIDQDARGVQGYATLIGDSLEAWIKPLQNNNVAVCFLNRSQRSQTIKYDWSKMPVADSVSGTFINFNNANFMLRDVWKKANAGDTKKPFNATIPAHDVVMLMLTKEK